MNTEELVAENARLKAELRKRAVESLSDIGQLGEQSAEIANLKAEVERLRFEIEVHRQGWNSNDAYEYDCKLQVAKMRRAKEGKQS